MLVKNQWLQRGKHYSVSNILMHCNSHADRIKLLKPLKIKKNISLKIELYSIILLFFLFFGQKMRVFIFLLLMNYFLYFELYFQFYQKCQLFYNSGKIENIEKNNY